MKADKGSDEGERRGRRENLRPRICNRGRYREGQRGFVSAAACHTDAYGLVCCIFAIAERKRFRVRGNLVYILDCKRTAARKNLRLERVRSGIRPNQEWWSATNGALKRAA